MISPIIEEYDVNCYKRFHLYTLEANWYSNDMIKAKSKIKNLLPIFISDQLSSEGVR